MKTLTQRNYVYAHLKVHGSITQLEALNRFGCMRLGARIYELRRQGVEVVTEYARVKTRQGHATVARYRMVEDKWTGLQRRNA